MRMTSTACELSIVVPVYNEVDVIEHFHQTVSDVIRTLGIPYEILFVDDGSEDGTFNRIQELAHQDSHVAALRFSRNFGHQSALFAGLSHASGAYILMMDGDLQHPPSLIPELWNWAQQEFDIVYTIRQSSEGIGWFKKLTSTLFYKIFSYLTDVELHPNTADFRIITRQVCDTITAMDERDVFLRGIFSWVGFRQKGLEYTAHERAQGSSKYTVRKMLNLSLSGITSFSTVPIRLSLVLCGFSLLVACSYSLYALYVKFFLNKAVQGWTSLLILIAIFCSGIFIMLGIIGEYVAKIHLETKKRPRYIIARTVGLQSLRTP